MKTKRFFFLLTIIAITFSACKDTVLPDPCGENGELCRYDGGVFIINEGQFLAGNASISFYDPNTKTVEAGIFESVNGRQLGDIAQTMTVTPTANYIVVNNSQKVEVVGPASFKEIATITGFISPRLFFPVSHTKAYVSDLGGKMYVVDIPSATIIKEIPMDGWTENMRLIGSELYVVQRTSYLVGTEVSNVTIFNTILDQIVDQIEVNANPSSMSLDRSQNIWVVCGGDSIDAPALVVINPFTRTISKVINLEDKTAFGGPSAIKSSPDGKSMYYLNNALYKIEITAVSEPASPHISPSYSIYDFSIHPGSGEIYCADAIDFVQNGKVYRYSSDGTVIDQIDAGIAPGDFAFN